MLPFPRLHQRDKYIEAIPLPPDLPVPRHQWFARVGMRGASGDDRYLATNRLRRRKKIGFVLQKSSLEFK